MPVKFSFTRPWMRTWLLINQIYRLLSRVENSLLAEVGLTDRKHSVLLALKHLKNPVTVSDIAKWLDRNPNGISMLVNRMAKDNFVIKERDKLDQRVVKVEISEKGEQCFDKVKTKNKEIMKNMFCDLNDEELEKISLLLQKVRGRALDFLNLSNAKEITEMLDHES
ncbi:MAG: MarR family transcriptional regulator [Spirochaetes bacterium]|nr:MarR family transcriptional regulator [Spirochaetota bacterium]